MDCCMIIEVCDIHLKCILYNAIMMFELYLFYKKFI